jgi:mgtE-like transporter
VTTPTPDRDKVRARRVVAAPARAAVRPARLAAGGLRQTFAYWRAERSTLAQGFVAVWISSGGDLLAGLALGLFTRRLNELPSLLILVPAAIGMRGNIFGALGHRLGTSVHTGLFRVSREREGVLYQNVYAALLLSVVTSGFLAVVARTVSVATGLRSISIWDFMVISMLGGIISSLVVLVLTVILALLCYRRNWDLDSVTAPIVTFMGDTVTLPALFFASFLALRPRVTPAIGGVVAALAVAALVAALRTNLPAARRIIRESLVVLALAGILDIVAGTIIEHRAERFFTLPALAVLIPPFLEDAGALGSVLGGRLGSKLHLGAVEPHAIPERLALLEMTLLAPWGLSVFLLVGISAHLVSRAVGLASPGIGSMIAVSLIGGAIATVGAAAIAYTGAVATFRSRFDPDTHAVPIVTSSIDLVGTMALVLAVVFLGLR